MRFVLAVALCAVIFLGCVWGAYEFVNLTLGPNGCHAGYCPPQP
jgi:hypothetical protein